MGKLLSQQRRDVVIIGVGYVGRPLAIECTRAGHRVVGLDSDPTVVATLSRGAARTVAGSNSATPETSPVGFRVTGDQAVLANADVAVICVPTPLKDGLPDLTAVRSAAEAVSTHLHHGMLVVLESTTYPGTTRDVLAPILESSGLVAGSDFALAFSPERVDPGNLHFGIRNTPKVVGGLTPSCTKSAAEFYETLVDKVVLARGSREAEMAKLLENTYRHVNIALVNELARVSHELGIDFWDVLDCAATKPFGYERFVPGPGVGGHCIPIDPNYLSAAVKAKLGYPLRMVELAQDINHGMPAYVVRRIQDQLNGQAISVRGSSVLLVGVAYKSDVDDRRESPATPIASRLQELGARVAYYDPHVNQWDVDGVTVSECEANERFDIAVFLQHHSDVDPTAIVGRATTVLDTRGVLTGRNVHRL